MDSLPMRRLAMASWLLVVGIGAVRSSADDRTSRVDTESSRNKLTICLVGDSTVIDRAGWGAGFRELQNDRARCVNFAKSGRSSRSYRAEGWWKKCLAAKPDILLIQFGHNDQPGKGPQRESAASGAFRDHLRRYVDEARAAGAKPVLVTPLTRRRWTTDGKIQTTLAEYAEAATTVASEMGVPLLDLHRLSIEQCERIGPTAFRAFEPMTDRGVDHTHLNADGGRAVGRLVAKELIAILPDLAEYFTADRLQAAPAAHATELTNKSLELLEDDKTITIRQRGKTVLVYNKQSRPVPDGIDPVYRRSGFLHPVASPAGKVVTATFPADHPHQHGVFSAWVKTKWNGREVNFWDLAGGTGRVVHQRVRTTFRDGDRLGFEVDLIHRATQPPVVDILRERWRVTAMPTDGSFHGFDIESTQKALTDKPLIVQKYHYGGMAVRGPVSWLTGGEDRQNTSTIRNNLGSDRIKGNHERVKWVSLSGRIDDRPVTITVLCHADNFRAPQAARLHPTKPYFVFAPCVNGDFIIDHDHPLHSRYRFLITDATPDPPWLDAQWQAWCTRATSDAVRND